MELKVVRRRSTTYERIFGRSLTGVPINAVPSVQEYVWDVCNTEGKTLYTYTTEELALRAAGK